jgi:hypothetical protein
MFSPKSMTKLEALTVVTGKHYMPSAVGSTSFSMKDEMLHLMAGFNNIQHI